MVRLLVPAPLSICILVYRVYTIHNLLVPINYYEKYVVMFDCGSPHVSKLHSLVYSLFDVTGWFPSIFPQLK